MSDSHLTDRLKVEAETRNLAVVREFLHAAIKRSLLPVADSNKVVLAVDEAVANTIQHGYEGMEPGSVEVLIDALRAGRGPRAAARRPVDPPTRSTSTPSTRARVRSSSIVGVPQ